MAKRNQIAPRCTATSKRSGKPCQRPAIPGGRVCRHHGGGAPQVKAAARARLLALVDPALGVLARATRPRKDELWEPSAQEIAAARDILDRAGLGKGAGQSEGDPDSVRPTTTGFSGTLEELLITLRRVTVENKAE